MKPFSCRSARVLRHVMMLALVAALTGCGLATRPATVKQTYLLDPRPPAKAAAPVHLASLKVGSIAVGTSFRGRSFVYREDDLRYESDFYNEFFVSPSAMFTADAGNALAAAGIFREGLPASANALGDFV